MLKLIIVINFPVNSEFELEIEKYKSILWQETGQYPLTIPSDGAYTTIVGLHSVTVLYEWIRKI